MTPTESNSADRVDAGDVTRPVSDILTTREVAALLKKSRRTIEHWVDAGYLSCIRVGRSVLFERSRVLADLRRFNSAGRC
jgi:excisionase family DNA binding protein